MINIYLLIQPAKKKNNSKKSSLPSSNIDTKVEFLQTELAAAQTRIVQIDASLKDKEQMVAVLLARIKVFEERENQQIFDKYFPDNLTRGRPPGTTSAPVTNPMSSHYSNHYRPQCHQQCVPLPQCCHHTHNTVHCFSHEPTSEQSSNLEKKVATIALDTIELKSAVEQVKAAIHKLKHQNPDLANINYPETVPTLASEVTCDPTSSQSGQSSPNVSAASIEEFFPDGPNVSPQLNI